MEPTHDSLQAQGSRELEGTKARGRPACSWEFMASACCKRLDKEDFWMRFAILFSQWHTPFMQHKLEVHKHTQKHAHKNTHECYFSM